jgi:hypothetical protein
MLYQLSYPSDTKILYTKISQTERPPFARRPLELQDRKGRKKRPKDPFALQEKKEWCDLDGVTGDKSDYAEDHHPPAVPGCDCPDTTTVCCSNISTPAAGYQDSEAGGEGWKQ